MTTPTRIDLVRGWAAAPGWCDEREAAVLRNAVLSTEPGTAIVELGTWCGRSLLALADARATQAETKPGRRPLVSIDLYPEKGQAEEAAAQGSGITPHEAKNICGGLLSAFGVQDVHRWFMDAVEAAGAWTPDRGQIGVLYIDDDHSGERVIAEIEAWMPHLAEKAEICIHDYLYEPYGIQAAVERWLLEHQEWVFVEAGTSMARFRRRWMPVPRQPAVATKVRAPDVFSFTTSGTWPKAAGLCRAPLVSVLYNTWRLGGLDCLRIGLDRQTMDPATFEVVIVDALYPYRCHQVRELFRDAPYRVKHVNPTDNPFPRDHGNRARNDAIRNADGDVCVWWCDYSIADPDCLERHYAKITGQKKYEANSLGLIMYGDVNLDALHERARAALPWRTIDDYVDFVEALPADSPLWTTLFREDPRALGQQGLITIQVGRAFPYEFKGNIFVQDDQLCERDPRWIHANGPIASWEYYYAKNEATRRSLLLSINGWEESFDDGHTNDDTDIGRRLAQAGSGFVVDKGNTCFVPNVRPFFPHMRWKRPVEKNRELFLVLQKLGKGRAIQGVVNEIDQIPAPVEEVA